MKPDRLTLGLVVGGGLALLGAALGAAMGASLVRSGQAPPAPYAMPAPALLYGITRHTPRAAQRMEWRPPVDQRPQSADDQDDRARRIRVLVYRIRRGELSLASPEVTADVSGAVADQLEGFCPPRPSGNAQGAFPLDW